MVVRATKNSGEYRRDQQVVSNLPPKHGVNKPNLVILSAQYHVALGSKTFN
jgi:hypothetical protein